MWAGGQVLELVYEQHPAGPSSGRPRFGVSTQNLDCSEDLFIEVDDPGLVEVCAELGHDICEASNVAAELLLNRARRTQSHSCGGESLNPDGQGIGHGYTSSANETVEHLPHFVFVDHSGSIAAGGRAERT